MKYCRNALVYFRHIVTSLRAVEWGRMPSLGELYISERSRLPFNKGRLEMLSLQVVFCQLRRKEKSRSITTQ